MSARLLAVDDVCAKLGGISSVTLWKVRRDPCAAFPAPVVLAGTRILRWVEADVDLWISRQRPADALSEEKRHEMRVLGQRGGRASAEAKRSKASAEARRA